MITNFEMVTIQYQGEGHVPGVYYFGHGGLSIFFFDIFCFISGEAIVLWVIEYCVFANDSYVKNNESVTALRREYQRHFNIHRNQSVPTHQKIVHWVNALRTQGTLLDRRPVGGARTVNALKNVEHVSEAKLRSPNRSAWNHFIYISIIEQ